MSVIRGSDSIYNHEVRGNGTPFVRLCAGQGTGLRTGLVIACILSFAIGAPLAAEGEYLLGNAKEAGQVGEQLDGYIGLIDESAPEKIKQMVKDTNERRMSRYETIAQKRGTSVESVAKQAGAKILKRAKPGEMIQDADGKWTKK